MKNYIMLGPTFCSENIALRAIEVAKDEEAARHIHPQGEARGWNKETNRYDKLWYESDEPLDTWAMPERISVRLVGTTEIFPEGTVLCSSYNAG